MGYSDWDNDDRPAQERDRDWQATAGDFSSIPVIDVGGPRSTCVEDRRKVAAEIRDACTRVGFFYIKNHGIPQELVDGVFQQAEQFFSLPFEQKMKFSLQKVPILKATLPSELLGNLDRMVKEVSKFFAQ
jgi:isopenicillin N synthase-like dioxygenase